jgi:hypothetical protein
MLSLFHFGGTRYLVLVVLLLLLGNNAFSNFIVVVLGINDFILFYC